MVALCITALKTLFSANYYFDLTTTILTVFNGVENTNLECIFFIFFTLPLTVSTQLMSDLKMFQSFVQQSINLYVIQKAEVRAFQGEKSNLYQSYVIDDSHLCILPYVNICDYIWRLLYNTCFRQSFVLPLYFLGSVADLVVIYAIVALLQC